MSNCQNLPEKYQNKDQAKYRDRDNQELTRDMYDDGYEAWLEYGTITATARYLGVHFATAKRCIRRGYPSKGWDSYEVRKAKMHMAGMSLIPEKAAVETREVVNDLKYLIRTATEQLLQHRDGLVLDENEITMMSNADFLKTLKNMLSITNSLVRLEAFMAGRPEHISEVRGRPGENDSDPSTWSDERLREYLRQFGVQILDSNTIESVE